MDDMIQVIGIVGAVKNYVDSSKGLTFTVDRKYKTELHKIDDLFQTECIIQIIPIEQARQMVEDTNSTNYPEPDTLQHIKSLRQKIHLEIMNAGMELKKPEIIYALTNKQKERECTIHDLEKIWEFITKDETLPISNYSKLRERCLSLIQ